MNQTRSDLQRLLNRIDGKGYPAYKDIRGVYAFDGFTLFIDHVQGDPFAAPSRIRARLPMQVAGFPPHTRANRSRSVALRDFLTGVFSDECRYAGDRSRGSGKSGLIRMDVPGQEILERSAIIVTDEFVEARFVVGLPARGRRVLGRQAAIMLCEQVPKIADAALKYANLDKGRLTAHLDAAEDADALRRQLPGLGLVAFVADGSILPRRSGVDDRPLRGEHVIPFRSPANLRVEVSLPHAGASDGHGHPRRGDTHCRWGLPRQEHAAIDAGVGRLQSPPRRWPRAGSHRSHGGENSGRGRPPGRGRGYSPLCQSPAGPEHRRRFPHRERQRQHQPGRQYHRGAGSRGETAAAG